MGNVVAHLRTFGWRWETGAGDEGQGVFAGDWDCRRSSTCEVGGFPMLVVF